MDMDKQLHAILPAYVEKRLPYREAWQICTEADGYTVFSPCDWPQEAILEPTSAEKHHTSETDNDEGWYLCYIPVPLLAYYAVTGAIFLNGVGHCWTPSSVDSLLLVFRLHHALCAGSGRYYEELVFDFYQSTPSLKKAGFLCPPDAGGNIIKEVPIDWTLLTTGGQNIDDALTPLGHALTELFSVHEEFNAFVAQYSANPVHKVSRGPSVETVTSYMKKIIHGSDNDISFDPVYAKAIEIVRQQGKASIGQLHRWLHINICHAARLVEQMEKDGLINPHEGNKFVEDL